MKYLSLAQDTKAQIQTTTFFESADPSDPFISWAKGMWRLSSDPALSAVFLKDSALKGENHAASTLLAYTEQDLPWPSAVGHIVYKRELGLPKTPLKLLSGT